MRVWGEEGLGVRGERERESLGGREKSGAWARDEREKRV